MIEALLHESSRARTMPPDRILTCRCGTTLAGRGRSSTQDLTAEDGLTPLPNWTPGAKAIADDGLVAEERILHPALTMVIVRSRAGDRRPWPDMFAVLPGGIMTVAPRAVAVS